MGFPENILTKDEKVIRSLHPHWLTVFLPAVLGVVIIALAGFIVWLTPVDPTWDIVDWVIIGLGIIALLWLVAVPFLKWRTTRYVITNKRVAVRRGILSKSGQDIALSKITDVSFRQSLLDRITRSGSLNIETAGDSQDEDFSSIPRSNEVQQLLNRLIEEDVAAKGGFGVAAHRGHQMMGHRSYDDPSASPMSNAPYDDRTARPGPPADAQQPPQFEQPSQRSGEGSGGGWETGAGYGQPNRGDDRYRPPQDGGQWETPPPR